MNPDEIKNEEGRHYLRTWIIALKAILDWPEHQTLKWAGKWLEGPYGVNPVSMFYNDTSVDYITPLMMPDRLRKRLPGSELIHVREQLLFAILQSDSHCDRDPAFDWNLARERVEALLAEYGERLPASEAECKLWRSKKYDWSE